MELDQETGQQPVEEPAGPPEQKQLTINLDEIDDDDAPEEKGKAQTPETGGRKARRNQQIRGIKQEYETRLQQMQTEIAELRGRVSVPAPAGSQGPGNTGADPLETELASIEAQKEGLLAAIQALPQNDPRVPQLAALWQKLHDRREDIRDERRQAKRREKEPGRDPKVQRAQHIQATLEEEFPQVYSDNYLRARAQAEFAYLTEKLHKPDGLATAREACQRALGKTGQGRPIPGPTDLERSRYSGIPARAGANGGGAGNQWVPNRFEVATARAWTKNMDSSLSDEERVRIWAKATGNMPRSAG